VKKYEWPKARQFPQQQPNGNRLGAWLSHANVSKVSRDHRPLSVS